MNKIHSTPFHPFEKQKVPDLVLKKFDMCVEFRDGSLSGDFSLREDQQWSRERRTATTQLAPTDTFVSFFMLRVSFRVFSLHARLSHLTRLASLTWNEKCKAWHSFSLTKATGTLVCCLFFFFRHHVRHVLEDPEYHYHLWFYRNFM